MKGTAIGQICFSQTADLLAQILITKSSMSASGAVSRACGHLGAKILDI